jgi:NAD(P)-dependent dehydrogenase (short-subunit alcohol dehydrogenase family)
MNVLVIGSDFGLGNVLCEKLSEQGHRVLAGVFHEKNTSPGFFRGDGILAYHMNVADESTLQKAASELVKRNIRIDAVVHVAGVLLQSDRENNLLTANIDDLMTAFKINAGGIIMAFRTFYPQMNKGGMYIAVTSEGGSFAIESDMFPEYSITKIAATRAVQILRCTVNDIDIIALHPGRMNTQMGETTAEIMPETSAEGICKIIDKKVVIDKNIWFIDYKGEKMALC